MQKLCSEHESLILFISIPLGAGMMDVSVKIHLLSVQLAWVILFIRTKRLYLRKSLGDNNSQLSSAWKLGRSETFQGQLEEHYMKDIRHATSNGTLILIGHICWSTGYFFFYCILSHEIRRMEEIMAGRRSTQEWKTPSRTCAFSSDDSQSKLGTEKVLAEKSQRKSTACLLSIVELGLWGSRPSVLL